VNPQQALGRWLTLAIAGCIPHATPETEKTGMSSSEPRLMSGDGLGSLPPPPLVGSQTLVSSEANGAAGASANAVDSFSASHRRGEDLPPLFSMSRFVFDAPPWLFSAGLHLTTVIILGLLMFSPERVDELLLRFDAGESQEDDFFGEDVDVPLDLSEENFDTALAPQQIPQREDALTVEPTTVESPLLEQPLPSDSQPIRMALSGREQGMRQALLSAYGGTRGTQNAVREALRWLSRNQMKNGMWSMTGRYTNGSKSENQEAATALALLAFQGAGYTPSSDGSEPFTRTVSKAWTALLDRQDENGNFFHAGRSTGQLYTQAICTIAICELYGMTQDLKYREPAQRAIDYCVKAQSPEGGWRYFPGKDSDLSVTGWFVMALQSARMAGLGVPSTTLDNITRFLDSVSRNDGSEYAYQLRQGATPSMSAEGLLCRQYLGWEHSDLRLQRGADRLIKNLPVWKDGKRDVYYWYYATQVCHHMESQHWRAWNEVMREVIPDNQVREGRERGSWDPQGDRWGEPGGRLFVTCLSTYMLEVYYRHLPIYQLDLLGGGL
jgi:hypothetical protein